MQFRGIEPRQFQSALPRTRRQILGDGVASLITLTAASLIACERSDERARVPEAPERDPELPRETIADEANIAMPRVDEDRRDSQLDSVAAQHGEGYGLVQPSDPMARTLGYSPSAEESPLRSDTRFGIHPKSQYCANCQHFTPLDSDTESDLGKCTLIAVGYVKSNAWCTAWLFDAPQEK